MIGLITMCLSLGLSSLSQTVPHLIASQGVIYAIGGALCYSPVIAFMDEWFVKRKGLAFGIMWVCLHTLTSNLFCFPLRKWAMKLLCVS
jgi:MFS family permease